MSGIFALLFLYGFASCLAPFGYITYASRGRKTAIDMIVSSPGDAIFDEAPGHNFVPTSKIRLRILSFNIQWAQRASYTDKGPFGKEFMMPVARLVAATGADVICIQEIQKSVDGAKDTSPAVARHGGDQPANMGRLLSGLRGGPSAGWSYLFGSNKLRDEKHNSGPAHFGNAIFWDSRAIQEVPPDIKSPAWEKAMEEVHPDITIEADGDPGITIKMAGDTASSISAHREDRCAVSVEFSGSVIIATTHLGFKERGQAMLLELLKTLDALGKEKTIVLCGDFNTYPEEGANKRNTWETPKRYEGMMGDLQSFGYLKAAGWGNLVPPQSSGASPYAGGVPGVLYEKPVNKAEEEGVVKKPDAQEGAPELFDPTAAEGVRAPGEPDKQQPCFVTFPYWKDATRKFDSHDHQLDYFFVRPPPGTLPEDHPKVSQFVPVAATGISDHHGLLLELEWPVQYA